MLKGAKSLKITKHFSKDKEEGCLLVRVSVHRSVEDAEVELYNGAGLLWEPEIRAGADR